MKLEPLLSLFAFLVPAAVLAASGCSPTDAATPDAPDAADVPGDEPAGNAGASDASADATPPASSVTDASGADGAPEAAEVNGILAIEQVSVGDSTRASVFGFFALAASATDAPCVRTAFPTCDVVTCDALVPAPDAGTSPPTIHAGPLTITGGAVPTPGLTLLPSPLGYQASHDGALFGPGDVLTVAAAGGGVGAFTGTLTAPRAATMISPVSTPSGHASVARSAPFTVTWAAAAPPAGTVRVMVGTGRVSPSRSVQIACTAPAAAGALTVPAAALAMLDATVAANVVGLLSLASSSETAFDVPGSPTTTAARVSVQASLVRGWPLDVE